jgi:hypothetical protein
MISAKPKPFTLSAAALSGCLRGVYFAKLAIPEPPVEAEIAHVRQIFGMLAERGKQIQEDQTQEWRERGVLFTGEKWIPWNEWGLTGKYDALCQMEEKLIHYEIKGVSSDLFSKAPVDGPRDDHTMQSALYNYMLRLKYPEIETRLLYVDRRTGERLELPVTCVEEEVLEKLALIEQVREAVDRRQPPPAANPVAWDAHERRWRVNFASITCKYHSLCLDNPGWYSAAEAEADRLNSRPNQT